MLRNDISLEVLRELIALKEKREQLQSEIEQLDAEIAALSSGRRKAKAKKAKKAKTKRAAKKRSGKRKGGITNKVVAALKAVGSEGISIQQLAAKLKINPQNLYVWFSATGKSMPEVKKVARATYAYIE